MNKLEIDTAIAVQTLEIGGDWIRKLIAEGHKTVRVNAESMDRKTQISLIIHLDMPRRSDGNPAFSFDRVAGEAHISVVI